MKKKSAYRSAFFNPRVLISFAFCAIGVLLALLAFAFYPGGNALAAPRPQNHSAVLAVAQESATRLDGSLGGGPLGVSPTPTPTPATTCTPPPPDMVGWWPGDNTPTDIQGGNDVSFQGAETYGTGEVAEAFSFDGSNYATAGNPAALDITGSEVTIDAWVNPSVDMTTEAILFGKWGDGFIQYVLEWESGLLEARVNNGNTTLAFTPPTGTWTHLALVYDGSATPSVKLYVNGDFLAFSSSPTGNINSTTSPFLIGGTSDGRNFNGLVDEVEVFNRALTVTEIQGIYQAGSFGKCKPTPTPTATATATDTPTATATATATATDTPTPTATATDTPTPTATATDTPTPTATATDTPTPTATATDTPTPTATATDTPTPTATATDTPTPTATATDTPTPTATATPDCTNYTFSASSGTIVPGTTDIGNHTDDGATSVSLPFPVKLYGNTYTTANAGSNGYLSFDTSVDNFYSNCLPNAGFTFTIFPFETDQNTVPAGRGIFTLTTGTAPNRTFYIEWRNCLWASSSTCQANSDNNYEIVFQEGVSDFSIIYGAFDTPNNTLGAIGVQGASGFFTQSRCNLGPPTSSQEIYSLPPSCTSPTPTATATANGHGYRNGYRDSYRNGDGNSYGNGNSYRNGCIDP